jgi:murein DD-endopeptidase MepM/ murein hydrolase activator NlpD
LRDLSVGGSRVVFSLAGVLLSGAAILFAQTPDPRQVTLSLVNVPGPLKPGGVGLVTVQATENLSELSGEAAGRAVHFWPGTSAREWYGLAGISVDSTPGPITLSIQGKTAEGTTAATRVSVLVERHQFATRRLQVDAKMANPPAEEVERIKQEAEAMAEAFAALTPQRLWQGPFSAPVPGAATSSFGRLTITNGRPSGRHQGTDFRAATGTMVRAPNAGRIVMARSLYFAGNTVIIDHGLGVFSLLAHLSRINVEPGANVARGDVLGESGATGRVTGPHLHWAVRFGDMSIDPMALMTAVAGMPDTPAAHPSH